MFLPDHRTLLRLESSLRVRTAAAAAAALGTFDQLIVGARAIASPTEGSQTD